MQITAVPDDPRRKQISQYADYVVWYDPLPHRPYGLFRVYKGQEYIGAQLSVPCESDCRWLDLQRGIYATQSFRDDLPWGWVAKARGVARRGRPRKADAERELQEAMAA